MKRILTSLALCFTATMAQSHEFTLGNLEVIHPNIPLPAHGALSAAGYMVISNSGATPDRLVAVHSDLGAHAMMHVTKVDGHGVAQMHPLDGADVPADDSVVFEPGGMHVMFMGLDAELHEGDIVPARLIFEHAGEMAVEFMVAPAETSMNHTAMDHGPSDHGGTHQSMMTGKNDPEQISALLMDTFDRPDSPLTVEPITVRGNVAVAGWSQDGQGGRAFLRKDDHGWFVEICAGESLVQPATFVAMGLGQADAELLAAEVNGAEAPLGAGFIARLNSFADTVVIGREGHEHHN